jgi:hypothetical protein
MTLTQRGFLWVLAAVVVVAATALFFAGVQINRLNLDAAAARQDVEFAQLMGVLNGRATSAQTLAILADGALPQLPSGSLAAVVDTDGAIIASSAVGGSDGEPVPPGWLKGGTVMRTGRWQVGGGAWVVAAPLLDRQGNPIATLAVEEASSAMPLLVHLLAPGVLWGLLSLLMLVPACWFGVSLGLTPLARRARAASLGLKVLRDTETTHPAAADVPPGFDRFSGTVTALLSRFCVAIEAVSVSGSDGLAPEDDA